MKTNHWPFLLLVLCPFLNLNAQNEFSKWYFGGYAGLDFMTSPPTVLTNGVLNTVEGCASVSDNTGNLLFYTDGGTVYNNTHAIMSNGTGLLGNNSVTQSALIVKQPGNTNIYYIFTAPGGCGPARYTIVDMNLAAGLGSVTVKNASIQPSSCEKQVAVRHCNGKDVWIVTHDCNTSNFRSFLLTSAGVNPTPVISAIGETPTNGMSTVGHLKISPDGKKLASTSHTNSTPSTLGTGGFHLFDFDASSGVVSNSLVLLSGLTLTNTYAGAYGVEFSPDGTKLYGTTCPGPAFINCILFQWNICAPTNSAIIASQYSINLNNYGAGSVQRAIDGKLYVTIGGGLQSLSVINNPNASGAAMNFVFNGLSIVPKTAYLGLPNFINTYTKPAPPPFTNTIACQTTSFSIPPVPTFSSGCTSTPYAPNGYLWDFGEPSSGAANTSTLSNPMHYYSSTGNYTASLILFNACTNDTIRKVISISTSGPTVNVSGMFDICKGDKYTYTVSGGSSYAWSTGATASTTTLSSTQTAVYTASATLNGCTLAKSFTVNVSTCTGIDGQEKNNFFRIFPNPVKDYLSIETSVPLNIVIVDMNGSLVFKGNLIPGNNEINTNKLRPGVYIVQTNHMDTTWRERLVKIE